MYIIQRIIKQRLVNKVTCADFFLGGGGIYTYVYTGKLPKIDIDPLTSEIIIIYNGLFPERLFAKTNN